ncbi:hypothetical protein BGZ57DRAFT_853000 [Hyaloscypha finlandica]|nr:hypothetical protein BGZ57DRAFT_853000 [Hyaloscypha finlandica]
MALPEENKKRKRISEYFKTDNPAGPAMVRIYVGSQRRLWVLPEEALCDRVQFFKSTFQGGFREGDEKVLELPEDDPIAFGFILDRILQRWATADDINKLGDPEVANTVWCRTWVLADKLGCSNISTHVNSPFSHANPNMKKFRFYSERSYYLQHSHISKPMKIS